MVFVNPLYNPDDKNSARTITSRECDDNSGNSCIRGALEDFYWTVWGSGMEVNQYQTNDAYETVESDHTQLVYNCRVKRSISGAGFT